MPFSTSGVGKFVETVRVRSQPSTNSEQVATYYPGETVRYDSIVEGDGRLWISYIGQSGNRRYCCLRDRDGSIYIEVPHDGGSQVEGLQYLQKQSSHEAVRKEGCLFCSICWIANLKTIQEVDRAFEWARSRGKVRSDSYILMSSLQLAREIAQQFGRDHKRGYNIEEGRNHFYVVLNGREVYNSMGWGAYH
jgi:hypothetical protein